MRHVAWLNTAPRAKEGDKPMTRLQRLRAELGEDHRPAMPPVEHGGWLIGHLFEVGPAASTGMGVVPVSWQEVAAWMDRTGVHLTPWAARTLRRLSVAYVAEQRAAEDPAHPPPWLQPGAPMTVAAQDPRERMRNLAKG